MQLSQSITRMSCNRLIRQRFLSAQIRTVSLWRNPVKDYSNGDVAPNGFQRGMDPWNDYTAESNRRDWAKALLLLGFGTYLYRCREKYFQGPGFTVHAAKPMDGENSEYVKRFGQEKPVASNPDTKSAVTVVGKKKSRREVYNVIADVIDETAHAVVCINVNGSASDWFGGGHRTQSNGSGFIISPDGLIVTNAHVVENAKHRDSIQIQLHNSRVFPGRVVAVDTVSDLALVQINATGLPTLRLGCSSDTRIGETVVAIGSPLSLSNSVTAGVVSSVNRGAAMLGINNNLSYIQTDATITFGNSGGPLVNLDGEAIGVNSMTVAAGISFAIPIDHVKAFIAEVEELKRSGKLKRRRRRYLGITLITLTDDIIANLEQQHGYTCPARKGVLVMKVVVGSPAFLAGIKPGDVIEKVNDKDVRDAKDINDAVDHEEHIRVIVKRDNRRYQCEVYPDEVL